ncbi:MAG: maltodextrin glucosidase [Chloroflexi bacterium]|nr:maltodextrin glucosidase [Chloroflexota bacterium]
MLAQLHWTAGLHHDGSELYVSNPLPRSGETVTIRLRVPMEAPVRHVFLRTAPDGEENLTAMRRVREDSVAAWWETGLTIRMPRTTYRFKVMSSEGAYWYNALGASRADSPDWFDFKLLADFAAPSWLEDAVFYQIFPDRFYNGDPSNDVPPGAWTNQRGFATTLREWGAPPLHWNEGGGLDFYGGDLQGITHKLDYLHDLGVTALYLNPIFTAYSNHRYDTADYDTVDPYLGGNEALVELRQALDRAGMRLVLDVTPNHTGYKHTWFTAAQADPHAPTADYFTFYRHPDDYESWLGHRSLAKLNYRSERLREAMYGAPDSVLRRWLRDPYRIDGWRLDVANMTARQGMQQLDHKIWRGIRRAVKADNPEVYLFGENFFDGTPHLQGDELDAVMNYQGFTIPLWHWLRGRDLPDDFVHGREWLDPHPLPAEAVSEQWTRFRAAVPWAVARQQFNQLGSHDTPRILSIVGGDTALLKLGAALLLTFPGVPCVYYGDEIGMEGLFDPDNRRCMRWDENTWDNDVRGHYQRLIALRRQSSALRQGGFQMVAASDGLLAYLRQSPQQRLLLVGYRGPEALPYVELPLRHAGYADGTRLTDFFTGADFTIRGGAVSLENLTAGTTLLLEG